MISLEQVKAVTLGDATSLGRARLVQLLGHSDADRIFHFADAGNDRGAAVKPRGPPKTLASEASFPPLDEPEQVRAHLLDLASTLCCRMLDDAAEHGPRPPRKLLVTWRRGYAQGPASEGCSCSTMSTTRGVQHTRSTRWPAELSVHAMSSCSSEAPLPGVGQSSCASQSIASAALRVVLESAEVPLQITRLIVSAEFDASAIGKSTDAKCQRLSDFWSRSAMATDTGGEAGLAGSRLLVAGGGPSAEEIDPATLAELPPAIREEIEREMALDRQSQASGAGSGAGFRRVEAPTVQQLVPKRTRRSDISCVRQAKLSSCPPNKRHKAANPTRSLSSFFSVAESSLGSTTNRNRDTSPEPLAVVPVVEID